MLSKRNPGQTFDEMQVQVRNKLGKQCFFLLFYLLLADLLLKDYGVGWAGSPQSIVVIMLVCMGYYLVRIVLAGAYVSTLSKSKQFAHVMFGYIAVLTITVLSVLVIIKTNFFQESFNISYNGIIRLLVFYLIFFSIIIVSTLISRRISDKGND